jgi:hypothetical protein
MAPPMEVLVYASPLCLALARALNLPLGISLDSPSAHDVGGMTPGRVKRLERYKEYS